MTEAAGRRIALAAGVIMLAYPWAGPAPAQTMRACR